MQPAAGMPGLLWVCIRGRSHLKTANLWMLHGLPCCRISYDRGYLSIFAGMWAGYELSVTRALGHKNLEAYGVLCEPSVYSVQLQPEDTCLVSDVPCLVVLPRL